MERWQKRLIWIAIFLAGLWFLVSRLDLEEVLMLSQQVHLRVALGMTACIIASFFLWNLRWQFSLSRLTKLKFFTLFPILMAGMFFNMITPTAGMGGEPIRVYYLGKLSRARKTSMFVLTACEKLFGTAVLAVMLAFSLIYAAIFIPGEWIVKGMLIVLFVILILILLALLRLLKTIRVQKNKYLRWLLRLVFRIQTIAKNFQSYREFEHYVEIRLHRAKLLTLHVLKKPRFIAANILLTIAITLLNYLAFYLGLVAFDASIPFLQVMVVFTIASVVADITFIPGGAGLTEAIAIGMYNAFGVPLAIAALATLLYRVMYYFLTIGGGYCCLVYLHMKE